MTGFGWSSMLEQAGTTTKLMRVGEGPGPL